MRFILTSSLVVFGLFLCYVGIHRAYRIRSAYEPAAAHVVLLRQLGEGAILSGDVPVAALVLYGDRVIGRGQNTVLRDTLAGGHAEVNAVTDALRQIGRERFAALDRDSLLLLSTFEPCAMCSGMMLEHRIKRTAFIEPKSLWHTLREDLRALTITWNERRSAPEDLQDSLFRAHPAYDPSTADH